MNQATQAAVLKALLDEIKKAYEQVRAGADDRLRALYDEAGVTQIEVKLPGQTTPIAKISLASLADEAAVAVDQAALLAWCRRNHPDEVVTVEQVRPSFADAVVKRLKFVEDADAIVHTDTGEVVTWARLVPKGPPRATMTYTKTGRDAIAAAWRGGALALPDVLAIGGGTEVTQ